MESQSEWPHLHGQSEVLFRSKGALLTKVAFGALRPVPPKLRVEYEGAIYHVLNRGDRREPIFKDDADHQRFLDTLGEACVKTDWEVHAYCLMNNHFHLLLETPKTNLVAGMNPDTRVGVTPRGSTGGTSLSDICGLPKPASSQLPRERRSLSRIEVSGRYKSLIVDGSGDGYLKTVCDYVYLNPVRARLLRDDQPLREYRWSSFLEYLKSPADRKSSR